MLHAKLVRAYTHTLRLHMMCTPFLVYTYVIHSNIVLYDHYCVIVYFPFYFQVFLFGVYKQYTQLRSTATAWNFTGIWHMAHGCLDIRHFTKDTSGISYILMEIPTYYYHADSCVLRGIFISLHFITVWLHPDVYPFYCIYSGTPCTHCVDIVAFGWHIRNVYIWYTYSTHLSTKRYIVYTTCIHPVSFF